MEALWPIITVLGPLLLGAVVIWAMLRNRQSSKADIARTEDATRKLYEQENRAEDARENHVER